MKLTFPCFSEDEINNLRECLNSGHVTQGPFVDRFEQRFRQVHACGFALATTSCTAALHLAMAALAVGPGDEVLVPAFTWITSAHCAEYMGAKAVFVDVDPTTFNIDPAKIEAAITPNTKAIVAVHLFGLSADMDPIMAVAKKHGLAVVEDAACAIGTQYKGQSIGAIGDLGAFSFHPRKAITTGEGGMVSTNDEALAIKVASLRNHGSSVAAHITDEELGPWSMNDFPNLGFNLRLSDIQAAVGVAQFDKLADLLAHRRATAALYHERLGVNSDIQRPGSAALEEGHTYQSYVIRLPGYGRARRNAAMAALRAQDIMTRPGTHCPAVSSYYGNKYGTTAQDFPIAATLEHETITLPLFPGMQTSDVDQVCQALLAAL